jgi:fatty acid desaturase
MKHRQRYALQAPTAAPSSHLTPRLAEFALDAVVVAGAICLGVAIKLAIGPWAVWLYAGLCLLLVAYVLVNAPDDDGV